MAIKNKKNINKDDISVLIPDGEIHVLLYVINCLSFFKNIKVYVMSNKKKNHMKHSRFVEKFFYHPETTSKAWISAINDTAEAYDIDLIMPIYENAIRTLVENKSNLNAPQKLSILPNLDNLNTAGNKGLLYLFLMANQIPCPDSIIVKLDNLPDTKEFNYPLVVKPVKGGGGGLGIEIIKNKEALTNYYQTYSFDCDTIIQEFIEGYDVCCNVLCKEGEVIAYSIQKGTLFRDGILTPQIGFDFIENEALFQSTKKLMKTLNWSGVANIDWRFDKKNNVFKVIEINTRFWLGTDASAIAGVNFPYLYCLSSLGVSISMRKTESISYLSLEGLAKKIRKNPLFILKFKSVFKYSPIRFLFRDPLPMLNKIETILRRSFS